MQLFTAIARIGTTLLPGLCCLVALALPAAAVTTRTVNTTTDDQNNGCTTDAGGCTLREAIGASAAGDTINFAASLNGGMITLNGNELTIGKNLTITGPSGGVAVSGNHTSRVFNIVVGGTTVRISNLTIRDGSVKGARGAFAFSEYEAGGVGGDAQGGGIRNNGALTLINCTLSGNAVTGGYGGLPYLDEEYPLTPHDGGNGGVGEGGGIYNAGSLILRGCTLSGNVATGGAGNSGRFDYVSQESNGGSGGMGRGGAIANAGTLTPVNCTLSGNVATGGAGGIGISSDSAAKGGNGGVGAAGGIYNAGTLTLTNDTLSGNTASGGAGGDANNGPDNTGGNGGIGQGGGLLPDAGSFGTASVLNTIIAGNSAVAGSAGQAFGTDGVAGTAAAPDVQGQVNSQGHNLIGNTAGSSGWVARDAAATPLNLTALADYGGATPTRALMSGSAALDAGDDIVLSAPYNLTTDQRGAGYPRKIGAHVDIGAFEFKQDIFPSATLIVNTLDEHNDGICDASDCSLLEALNAANADVDADTINFKAGLSGTIKNTIATNGLTLANPVTINGPGARALTISGNDSKRVFNIRPNVDALISGLSITNGYSLTAATTGSGGAIFNEGTLTLVNCAVLNNSGGSGGGVANQGALTVIGCTFAGNRSTGHGGAIRNASNTIQASAVITNSTFFGNVAASSGAITSSGTSTLIASVTLTNCTVSGNSGTTGAYGGGIFNAHDGTFNLSNTIVAGNSAANGPDAYGAFNSLGYNLIGKTDGSAEWIGDPERSNYDLTGTSAASRNPQLGPLQNNGGPTDTMALLAGSPAIDQANSNGLTTDQRGRRRPYDDPSIDNRFSADGCDIGAFEFSPVSRIKPDALIRTAAETVFIGNNIYNLLSSTVGSEAWNSRDLKSRPH